MENLHGKFWAPTTGNEVSERPSFESMRSRAVKTAWLRRSRRIAKALGLGAALLIATAFGTADAQDLSGSWQKVRQGCKPGQLTCGIKAKFTVQNLDTTIAGASFLGIYLSDDATFDGADTLLQQIVVDPVAPLGSNLVKMALDLADPTVAGTNEGLSASNSFLIAVVDDGDNVTETNEANNVAVFANPGPPGIILFDKLFGPDVVTIKVGTRVRWMHRDDGQDHTVTGGSCETGNCIIDEGPAAFTSGHDPLFMICDFIDPGSCDEFLHVFDVAGNFPYFCEKHEADMTGTIIVVP